MKVLVAVALFAFVALQESRSKPTNQSKDDEDCPTRIVYLESVETNMSHGAPAPEEEKKEETPSSSPSAAPTEVTSEAAAAAVAEVKSEAPSSDAPAAPAAAAAAPAAAETAAPAAEEKKP